MISHIVEKGEIPKFLILVVLTNLLLFAIIGCAPSLPDDEKEVVYYMGFSEGYTNGYALVLKNPKTKVWWITPDMVDKDAKTNPSIREDYIPKGYWTHSDVAKAHFSDGTPFNEKQKKEFMEGYNWGFYSGFRKGADDCLEGRPPTPPFSSP